MKKRNEQHINNNSTDTDTHHKQLILHPFEVIKHGQLEFNENFALHSLLGSFGKGMVWYVAN